MDNNMIGDRIRAAIQAAGLAQRDVARAADISQSTLSRIVNGDRAATMTELIQIAHGAGVPLGRLTGKAVEERVEFAARATNASAMKQMREVLVQYLELDAFLAANGIR